MEKIICAYCGLEVDAIRPKRKKFCSCRCSQRFAKGLPDKRDCRICGKSFPINKGDQNRRYCSEKCSKKAYQKSTLRFHESHPEIHNKYNQARLVKNPGAWTEKHRNERLEAIRLLGGECVVCRVKNPNWLHIDYIPTTNGKPYRHPRHLKYIKENLSLFRLLCANHHYELTLTGTIEGTTITQNVRRS